VICVCAGVSVYIRVRICAGADIIIVEGLLSTVDITYRLITAIDIVVRVDVCIG